VKGGEANAPPKLPCQILLSVNEKRMVVGYGQPDRADHGPYCVPARPADACGPSSIIV
jgi:hypothetical protein